MYIIEHSLWVVLAAENKKNMSFNYVVLFRGSCQNTYIFVFFELILRAVFIPFCNSKIADKWELWTKTQIQPVVKNLFISCDVNWLLIRVLATKGTGIRHVLFFY